MKGITAKWMKINASKNQWKELLQNEWREMIAKINEGNCWKMNEVQDNDNIKTTWENEMKWILIVIISSPYGWNSWVIYLQH